MFFAATWLLLGWAGSSRMFRDPGVFWHLLTGERILQRGMPHEDWLTFTFRGRPWIAHQWLAEVAMALLHRLGGYDALLVVASGGVALLATWIFQRLVDRGLQPRWAALLAALAIETAAGSIHVRPLLLSMVFFAWTFALLVEVEAGRLRVRSLAWLLPLTVLWVNCHGAVIGGIATLGLVIVHWIGSWLLGGKSPVRTRADALRVASIALGVIVAPLVNPYGLELVRTWSTILRSPVVAELIVEHGSVWRTNSWYVLPLALAYLAAWVGAGPARWRASSLVTLVWLVLMFQRIRHAPLFAVAALLSLAEFLPRSPAVMWFARRGVEIAGRVTSRTPLRPALWLAPVLALMLATLHFQHTGKSMAGPRRGPWPFALKPAIAASARSLGPNARILNDMEFGGFLAHEVPEASIFGDDRCELYDEQFLRGWITGGRDWFAASVDRYDIRLAVARRGTALDAYLRATPAWREVASAGASALFRRDEGTSSRSR